MKTILNHDFVKEFLAARGKENSQSKKEAEKTVRTEALLLEILIDLVSLAGKGWQPQKPKRQLSFIEVEELLSQLFSRSISVKEAQNILNNIYFYPAFYQGFNTKLYQLLPALNGETVPELASVKIMSDKEILSQLLRDNKKSKEAVTASGAVVGVKIWQKIKDRLTVPKLEWASALAGLLILFSVGYFGLRYYNTAYQVGIADNLLKNNYRISIEGSPRLSGEFATKGISMLMDGDEPDEIYLTAALERIKQAEASGYRSPRLKQLEAKIYIIKNELARADSILNTLKPEEKNSAPVLNDIGVVSFMKEDWDSAVVYFERAIKKDPSFKQAYYNLALVYSKQGEYLEATEVLQQALDLETDQGWKNAIKNLIRKLKTTEDPNTKY